MRSFCRRRITFNHEMAITIASCRPVLVATDQITSCVCQPSGALRQTRAVVTISPNNPTGAVYSEAALREVNQICRERGIYHSAMKLTKTLLTTERTFSPDPSRKRAHTISLFSFPSLRFASWRVGYMSCRKTWCIVKRFRHDLDLRP